MIPYTVDRRPDTGVTNLAMGVWLLLASEAMLFGALFSSYVLLRTAAPVWPPPGEALALPLGAANTALLTAVAALVWQARRAGPAASAGWLASGTLLGVLFLVLLGIEYATALLAGTRPSASTYLATYFTLTGVHAVHVLLGVGANLRAIAGVSRVAPALTRERMLGLSLYWLFVAGVWAVMFWLVYLA